MPTELQDLIQFLQSNNFKAECPNCNGKMELAKVKLNVLEKFKLAVRVKGPNTASRMVKQVEKEF